MKWSWSHDYNVRLECHYQIHCNLNLMLWYYDLKTNMILLQVIKLLQINSAITCNNSDLYKSVKLLFKCIVSCLDYNVNISSIQKHLGENPSQVALTHLSGSYNMLSGRFVHPLLWYFYVKATSQTDSWSWRSRSIQSLRTTIFT